jgi:hypothetical protein
MLDRLNVIARMLFSGRLDLLFSSDFGHGGQDCNSEEKLRGRTAGFQLQLKHTA